LQIEFVVRLEIAGSKVREVIEKGPLTVRPRAERRLDGRPVLRLNETEILEVVTRVRDGHLPVAMLGISPASADVEAHGLSDARHPEHPGTGVLIDHGVVDEVGPFWIVHGRPR
jgi:hypothetical protein